MNQFSYSVIFLPNSNYNQNLNLNILPTRISYLQNQMMFPNWFINYENSTNISRQKVEQNFTTIQYFSSIQAQHFRNSQKQEYGKKQKRSIKQPQVSSDDIQIESHLSQQKKKKKKYTQNPKRNVITSLGSQLLAILGNKSKLNQILSNSSQKHEQETISSLLIYINLVKKAQNTYLSIKKMRDIWYPSEINQHLTEVIQLFRQVSYYYLTNFAHIQLIRSMKMKKSTKMYQLKGIKQLIFILRNPQGRKKILIV